MHRKIFSEETAEIVPILGKHMGIYLGTGNI
jgi:hypothetical protein